MNHTKATPISKSELTELTELIRFHENLDQAHSGVWILSANERLYSCLPTNKTSPVSHVWYVT